MYLEALQFSHDNPEILTTIGLLYIRLGENYHAFQFLADSLAQDPKNAKVLRYFIFLFMIDNIGDRLDYSG